MHLVILCGKCSSVLWSWATVAHCENVIFSHSASQELKKKNQERIEFCCSLVTDMA